MANTMPAGKPGAEDADDWREPMVRDLTLMLLWLTSWDERGGTTYGQDAGPLLRSWIGYDWDAMDALRDERLIEGRKGNKSVYLTQSGAALAETLVDRYRHAVDAAAGRDARPSAMSLLAQALGIPSHYLPDLYGEDDDADVTVADHIDTRYAGVDDPRSFLFRVTLRMHDVTDPAGKPLVCLRDIEIPAGLTFADLHHAIQQAFDWKDYHLWNIQLNSHGVKYQLEPMSNENSFEDYWDTRTPADADSVRLGEVFPRSRTALYTYDYGDDWEHDIKLVKTISKADIDHPVVRDSEGEAPPEDVGGPWGYAEFLKAYTDPNHPDHADMVAWKAGIDAL
ncbi:DUF6429 family protein [Bifidobacterium leontopitheci]|uniref:Plasmid pRiA4b ORF-3-like protein n=1 Tax=Bifidobacterium leontopitheci TaxID=2650774 RepID=A0A6I1GE89_9BIFI|nr:DUF6429 family protein [Bifidobacterium leontopitheci]KAB7789855.1 Plasmid pRiA4b ORF-3-like protein [Bifidobacterium leontopitheci]